MYERSDMDVVFVAGPPGAGKTTVSENYRTGHLNTEHFGTGELVVGVRSGDIDSEYSKVLREAASSGTPIPDSVFCMVVLERIMRKLDSTETVLVTGFPHDHSDWDIFNEAIVGKGIDLLGSITLRVGLETSVARMQTRDIESGMNANQVYSPEARHAYENRYFELMRRHETRLDCYKGSGLDVIHIAAEKPRNEVTGTFDIAMGTLKERKK